jgi:hypothetical protein
VGILHLHHVVELSSEALLAIVWGLKHNLKTYAPVVHQDFAQQTLQGGGEGYTLLTLRGTCVVRLRNGLCLRGRGIGCSGVSYSALLTTTKIP